MVTALVVSAYDDLVITRVAMLALINMVLVIGLYTFSGLSGTLSFGHVAFAAIGAYTTAYLTIPSNLKPSVFPDMPDGLSWLLEIHASFPAAIVISGLVAAFVAVCVAPAVVRLASLQGAIATFALLVIVYTVLNNWTDVTRGQSTMFGVPADLTLTTTVIVVLCAIVLAWLFSLSNSGLRLKASREDEVAAKAAGIHIIRERTEAWILSAFITGAGGSLYSHFITTFNPDQFYLAAMFVTIAMLIIGGMKSLSGAVFGALAYSAMAEILRRVQDGDPAGIDLPAGTSELLLALILLIVLIKWDRGITRGREVPFPSAIARWTRRAAPQAPTTPRARGTD